MYHYSPPKSSIWGHSLKKMEPARQKALFDEFLGLAVAEHSFTGGSFTLFPGPTPPFLAHKLADAGPWGHVTNADVQGFEQLLGVSARAGAFHGLTHQQCETALNEIIQNSALIPGVILLLGVRVSKWKVNDLPVTTESTFNLYYGMKPCLSTFLQFQTFEQFEFIKKVLADLKFCVLNEKHLKPKR